MESRKLTLGKTYSLKINRFVDFGCYLDGENLGEILLPIRYVPKDAKEGDEVEIFVHTDSEDRIIATNEKPYIQVGQFAALKAVSVTKIGAFMDWGLMKDLFVPFFEQQKKMEEGNTYVVFAYVDTETNRIAASSKLDQFMTLSPPQYEAGEEVDIIICNKSPLGYKAIINESHWGLIYENQVFEKIKIGDKRKAYIANIRNDDKIDLVLNKTGLEHIDEVAQKILEAVKQEEFIALHDKSKAEEIKEEFGISKKAFKKAIGSLYKKRLIAIEDIGIRYIGKK
jgi:predicted RNA-binding protein (virulence factor B family)